MITDPEALRCSLCGEPDATFFIPESHQFVCDDAVECLDRLETMIASGEMQ